MLMRWATRAGVGLLVVAMPGVVITFQAQPIPPGTFVPPFWARPFVALDAVAFYLYKTVWPLALTSAYGRSPQAVLETSASAYGTWLLPVAVALGSSGGIVAQALRPHGAPSSPCSFFAWPSCPSWGSFPLATNCIPRWPIGMPICPCWVRR